jgi:hypothetical protein
MASLPTKLNARAIAPRETAGLAAVFVLASAPHLARLPVWISALILIITGWCLYLAYRNLTPPAKWLLALIAIGSAAGILLQYRTLLGRDAGVALLVVMLALKLLETRSQRDGMLLGFLGCFLLVTNFLHSQTIATAAYMLGCAWLLITSLISLQYTG